MKPSSIVILTGAGISAESGLETFRGADGLWCDHRIEDVATPEAFARNPGLVHAFYNMRRRQLKEVEPNTAHHALAKLAAQWQGNMLLVTQNVDDLHARATQAVTPSKSFRLIHMHGELTKIRCELCEGVHAWEADLNKENACDDCGRKAYLRPHIVWFGEMPLEMEAIYAALSTCDLFLSIGTSGNVYPAAGFVQEAKAHGAHTVELNLEPSLGESHFHEKIYGPATEVVPVFVERLLK